MVRLLLLMKEKFYKLDSAKEIFENPKTLKVAEISNDPPMNILQANMDSK